MPIRVINHLNLSTITLGIILSAFRCLRIPLDVSYFSPLKTAYLKQIKHLVKNKIHYITKVEFLLVFNVTGELWHL
jgi:hypothetical protein